MSSQKVHILWEGWKNSSQKVYKNSAKDYLSTHCKENLALAFTCPQKQTLLCPNVTKLKEHVPVNCFKGSSFSPFSPQISLLFVPSCLFSHFSWKKLLNCFASSEKGRTFALAFRKRGARNSIFDRLRTEIQDKQRVHIIYIIYVACTSRSHSFLHRLINEQWSRKAWPVRQNYKNNNYYSEEFDPGSGWTLATGLTHASRGAADRKLAFDAGDRRMGESRVSNLPSARG